MRVRRQVLGHQRDGRGTEQGAERIVRQSGALARAVRRAALKVGQAERGLAVAAVGRPEQREQRRIRADTEQGAVGGRPAYRTEIKAEGAQFAEIHVLRGREIDPGDAQRAREHRGCYVSFHG